MENSSKAPSVIIPGTSMDILPMIKDLNLDQEIENCILIKCEKDRSKFKILPLLTGSENHVQIDLRRLFALILNDPNCDSFILAHNHPDGRCKFSQSDFDMAFRIARVSEWLQCMMIDFIVVTTDDALSIKDYDKTRPINERILDFQIATAFMDAALNLSNPFLKRFIQGCRNIRCSQPDSNFRRPDCGEVNLPLWKQLTEDLYYADPANKPLRHEYEKSFDELRMK